MVHVPFLGIDLPEPRLAALIPDTTNTVIHVTHKLGEYAQALLHPLTPEEVQNFNQSFGDSLPREFNRVRKRYAEGKIVNDEQMSSELEDASFDWYRRQLRTSVIGVTDEEMEDVAMRKLGLAKPSLQAAVQDRFLADAVAAAGGVDLDAELLDAQLLADRQAEQERQLAARVLRLADLQKRVRPTHQQALGALTNASAGMLLGVLLFKSVVMAGQRLFRRKKSQQKAPPQQQQQRRQSLQAPPVAAAPAAVMQAVAARPQQAAAAAQQQQAGPRQQAAAAAAQKAPQAAGKEQTGAATAQAVDASARKARAIKKR